MDNRPPFEPASLNDPVALTTAWTPYVRGGSNICTHTLVTAGPNRQAFRPTTVARLVYFFVLGVTLMPFAVCLRVVVATQNIGFGHAVLMFLGSLFLWFGVWITERGVRPIVFDKDVGMYWRGWSAPARGTSGKNAVPLDRIHALQVVSEYCAGKNSSFYSYELNLVLKDGSRMNVVDHGNRKQLAADGNALATFLGVPLWDPA